MLGTFDLQSASQVQGIFERFPEGSEGPFFDKYKARQCRFPHGFENCILVCHLECDHLIGWCRLASES